MRSWLTLLLLVGFTLICLPIGWILTSPSVRELRQERAYIATWPSVTDRLDRVTFQQELHTARGVIWYTVEVGYRYTVDERQFGGNRLGIDTQHYRHTSPEALEAQMNSSFMSPAHVVRREETNDGPLFRSRRISLHLANQPIRVYYDPKNPQDSLLDKFDYDPPQLWKEALPVLAFIALGLLIMTVSAARWRGLASEVRTTVSRPVKGASHIPVRRFPSRRAPASKGSECGPYPEGADWLDCHGIGQSFMRSGEYEKALAVFDHALEIAPGEFGTRHSELKILLDKARCLTALGRTSEAVRCLDETSGSAKGIDTLYKEAAELKESLLSSQPQQGISPVSPWSDKAKISSPDRKTIAVIDNTQEIGMGGPTSGVLRLSNGLVFERCNPSLVWSADSAYLAVPQWAPDNISQRLMIVSVLHKLYRYSPGTYRLLLLELFDNGIVTGIDSPRHMPARLRVDISEIDWG
jgi:tetratricopeptide (TPR) repeat protein